MTGRPGRGGNADIEIAARAKVEELSFEEIPETGTRFRGNVSRRSFSASRRRNLPDEVQSGVQYSDAEIEWRATGWAEAQVPEGGSEGPRRGHPGD